jgi:hypothetical protein
MKIEKKEGLKSIRVHHNKKIFWIIVVLFVILLAVIFSIKQIGNKGSKTAYNQTHPAGAECAVDRDCVSSSCCHSSSCVGKNQAPVCNGIMCSQECKENTLDCQQGTCACVDNKCAVKWSAGS